MYMNISTLLLSFFSILFLNTKDIILTDKPVEFSIFGKLISIKDKTIKENTDSEKYINSYKDKDNMRVIEMSTEPMLRETGEIPFAQAFRNARNKLGPGRIFKWKDNFYTTNYYYEMVVSIGEEVVKIDQNNKTFNTSEYPADILGFVAYLSHDDIKTSFEFVGRTRENYVCDNKNRYEIIE